MRRSISKIPYRSATASPSIASAFSTSSGGGGRGRGGPTPFQFTVSNPPEDESKNSNLNGASPPPHAHGRGRGRGVPVTPSSVPPSFSSFLNTDSNPAAFGRGRGIGFVPPNSFSSPGEELPKPNLGMPTLSKYEESTESEAPPAQTKSIPSSIFNVLTGAGRGKPGVPPAPQSEKPKAETHQTRAREQSQSSRKDTAQEQLAEEEKVRKAVGILSQRDVGGGRGGPEVRAERWEGGRGGGRGQGRGRGGGRGGGGFGGRGSQDGRYEDSEDGADPFLGDPAAEEKVAKRLGPQVMSELTEGFEEMSKKVLPTPMDDALLDAYETNIMVSGLFLFRLDV